MRTRSRSSYLFLSALTLALLKSASLAQQAPAPMSAPTPEKPAENKDEVKKPAWDTSAAVGVTLTRGNSKTVLVTGNVLSEKKWDKNEVRLGADAQYGEDHDTKNAESVHGFGQYNRLITDRFYGYARLDALHDAVADVDYRLTLSPGVGYYIIKTAQTTLSGEVGPGFIYEKQGRHTTGYATLRVAERLEHKLNDRVKLWESVEFLPQVDRFENYIINAEAGIDTSLTKKLSLRVFAVDTYDNQPAPGREKNDLKLVTAIAYKF
jgi:putative salt-induced outer membrane protein YdiY